ncbi:hypothetical protein ACFL1X_06845 [Candidatus Hydrogenedentota bacterium]
MADDNDVDVKIIYDEADFGVGDAVLVVDVNDDGFDDLLIGGVGTKDDSQEVVIYVVKGGSTMPTSVDLDGKGYDFIIRGAERASNGTTANDMGIGFFKGDFDGDGKVDWAVTVDSGRGAEDTMERAWETYVFLGESRVFNKSIKGVDLPEDADFVIFGPEVASDANGVAIVAGDINNDGRDDLVFGVAQSAATSTGDVRIIFGQRNF